MKQSGLFFTLIASAFGSAVAESNFAVLSTRLGRIRGSKLQTKEGVEGLVFLGLPYADPPVGPLRFDSNRLIDCFPMEGYGCCYSKVPTESAVRSAMERSEGRAGVRARLPPAPVRLRLQPERGLPLSQRSSS